MDSSGISHVERMIEECGREREALIPLLIRIQEQYHYLPNEALKRVSEVTGITLSDIMGVATFYSGFRFTPAGKHHVKVCVGTACHVKGADKVYDSLLKTLKIPSGEDTDKDKIFTVEKAACLGCCMLAPAVQIDDIIYGHLSSREIPAMLEDFLSSAAKREDMGKRSFLKELKGEIRLCTCSSCLAAGAKEVFEAIDRQIVLSGYPVKLKITGCTGLSYDSPLVDVFISSRTFRYARVTSEMAPYILSHHFEPANTGAAFKEKVRMFIDTLYGSFDGEPVIRYTINSAGGNVGNRLTPIVTEFGGALNPLDFEEYRQSGGFVALENVLNELSSRDVLGIIKESGLRGRGGGGFSTGIKWDIMASQPGPVKYIVCNGDEGDPGAFMDRMILESFPFRVIEGILIAARTVGANEGYLYIRSEYPLAVKRMEKAISISLEKDLLGSNVMGSGFSFFLKIVQGAGAFVCGEETALLASIEGRRGMPVRKPPFPVEKGLWGRPSLVNNVETLAAIPWILRNGAAAFSVLGTTGSKGTKNFALAGKIKRGGLIEVPMGITIKEIVFSIGGGIQDDKTFKAVQIGGPSGGCLPASLADTPVDYDALVGHGAIMGSGGFIVLDEEDCMVDLARYFMSFTQSESCGKCTFCRIGTKRMLEILNRLCQGRGKESDPGELEELSLFIQKGSLCGLGRTAPNPVLSTLHYFRNEYEAHILGRCPAGKCKALIRYRITDNCIGCSLCARNCPSDAILPEPYRKHSINKKKCIKCDTCREICPVGAVVIE